MNLHSPLRATARLIALGSLIAVLAPVQAVLVRRAPRRADRLARWFHGQACALLGIELRITGVPSRARPTLYVANHVSYIDVLALSAAVEACFVAKQEVAGWPIVGGLARLQRTVFVARRRGAVGDQVAVMHRRLDAGDNLALFPEGTSSPGTAVLGFKPALFAAAPALCEAAVQPVSIAYRALDGAPLDRDSRARVAWYGDMTLAPHFLHLVGRRRIAVELAFAPAVAASAFACRKALAAHCEAEVAGGLMAALSAPAWWSGNAGSGWPAAG